MSVAIFRHSPIINTIKITFFRFILASIRIALAVIGLVLAFLTLYIPDLLGRKSEISGFRVRGRYVRYLRWIFGVRLQVIDKPDDVQGLFVSNHRTLSDPLMIVDEVYAYIIAKHEVRSYPILGKGASLSGCVFVKRSDADNRNAVKETIRDILRDGKSVLIYPEGTTTLKRFSEPFKRGSIEVAVDLGVPIHVITTEYRDLNDYWRQAGLFWQFVQQFGKWRSHVYVRYHPSFVSRDLNSAMRKIRILIDGDIATYHGYDDFGPR